MGVWISSIWQGGSPLPTESSVDLTRYGGPTESSSPVERALGGRTLHETARLPILWQPARAESVTAFLSWDAATSKMYVKNSMWLDGRQVYVEGVAVRDPEADDGSNSKLLLTFKPNFTQPLVGPANQRYWILMVEPTTYRYAVVSGGERNTLWILSATPEMSEEDFAYIYQQLVQRFGYTEAQLRRLVFPRQTRTERS